MHWMYIVLAGLAEVAFAFCLGKAKDATALEAAGWYVAIVGCAALSFYLLNLSLAQVPLGTAYAVWTGIGAAGTATLGVLVFGDPMTGPRLFFLTTLLGSVLGLKVFSA